MTHAVTDQPEPRRRPRRLRWWILAVLGVLVVLTVMLSVPDGLETLQRVLAGRACSCWPRGKRALLVAPSSSSPWRPRASSAPCRSEGSYTSMTQVFSGQREYTVHRASIPFHFERESWAISFSRTIVALSASGGDSLRWFGSSTARWGSAWRTGGLFDSTWASSTPRWARSDLAQATALKRASPIRAPALPETEETKTMNRDGYISSMREEKTTPLTRVEAENHRLFPEESLA